MAEIFALLISNLALTVLTRMVLVSYRFKFVSEADKSFLPVGAWLTLGFVATLVLYVLYQQAVQEGVSGIVRFFYSFGKFICIRGTRDNDRLYS